MDASRSVLRPPSGPRRAALLLRWTLPLLILAVPAAAEEAGIVWRQWSDAVFHHARRTDRPVLLFLQAEWCGECREFESRVFGDPEVRSAVQEGFVAVRVDRDRRPDIYRRYGLGGVPTVAFLLPSGHAMLFQDGDKLIPAGSSRFEVDEMRRYLALIRKVYEASGRSMEKAAEEQFRNLSTLRNRESRSLIEGMAEVAGNLVLRAEDPIYGGLQGSPRAVVAAPVRAALERFAAAGAADHDRFARRALQALAGTPVRDPLEGGFYRLARRPDWSRPAPGLLLETQAEMLHLFLDALQVYGEPRYGEIAGDLCDLLLSRFYAPELRAFRASIFPTAGNGPAWSREELESRLEGKALQAAVLRWGLPSDPGAEPRAPRLARGVDEVAREMGISRRKVSKLLGSAARRLVDARRARDAEATDDTVITAWNARAASGLLRAAAILGREELREPAMVVLEYVQEVLTSAADGVFHGMEVRPARAIGIVLLEDQLAVAEAWLAAYELSGEPLHRERAEERLRFVTERFREPQGGALVERLRNVADVGGLRLPDRRIEENSLAAVLLLEMAALRPGHGGRAEARRLLEAFADEFTVHGVLAGSFGRAVDRYYRDPLRVMVLQADGGEARADRLRRVALREAPLWNAVFTVRPAGDGALLRSWGIEPGRRSAAWVLGPQGPRGPWTDAAALRAALQGEAR